MAKKKALVVDNDFFFVEFFTELLEKRDYQVFKAYNGKEGIDKLNEEMVDLLFVDFVMPKIDGRRLIRYVKQKFPGSPFPIVAVSGTIIEQLDDLHEIGADYYVAKGPLDVMAEQLNEFVDRIASDPAKLFSGKRVMEPGMVFPRREALDLLDSLHFQEAIFESVGVGIVTVDRDTSVLNANRAALGLLNKPAIDVVSQKVTTLFPEKDAEVLLDIMRKLRRNKSIDKIEFEARVNGNSLRVIASLFDLKGECFGWVLVLENGMNSA